MRNSSSYMKQDIEEEKPVKNSVLFFTRVVIGLLFITHIVPRIQHPKTVMIEFRGIGFSEMFGYLLIIIEIACIVLMLIGFYSHFAGLLLAFIVLFYIVTMHMPYGFNLVYARDLFLFFASLAIATYGPGTYAIRRDYFKLVKIDYPLQ